MNRMTNRALVLTFASAVFLSASAVAQTSQNDQAIQPGGPAKQKSPMPDTRRDGMVSVQNHAAAAEAMFQRMDADGDGYLTASELEQGRGMMAGAGTQGATGAGMMGPGMGHGRMDVDGDGAVSAQEHAAMAQMMFQRMDANGDGRITADEMGKGRGMMMGEGMSGAGGGMGMMGAGMGAGMSPADSIKMMDRDADGRISADEHRAGAQALFDEADSDKDQALSTAERAAHHAMMMQRVKDADQN